MTFSPPAAPNRAALMLLFVLASAIISAAPSISTAAVPQDLPQEQSTEHAQFRVRARSEAMPVPMRRIHAWRIHISDAAGAPVRNAVVQVSGGMPQHHHGLPTQPRVTESVTPGDYLISGIRFSMTGRWVLNLGIRTPDGRSDTVTFSFVL